MMKKLPVLLFLILLPLVSTAQSFPVAGATWIFRCGYAPSCEDCAEKWEYTGDSLVASGSIKKLKITYKTVNPMWISVDTTIVSESYRYFLYSGDTIRNGPSVADDIICNFSATVGDSVYTPYYNTANMNFLNANCTTASDSMTVFQKAIVSDAGTFTNGGISGRYYTLSYLYQNGDSMQTTFSERSLISEAYWYRQLYEVCGTRIQSSPPYLICYYDDSTVEALICPGSLWFETLENPGLVLSWGGTVFPDPASDELYITNPGPENIEIFISDLNGKVVKEQMLLLASSTLMIDISLLVPGVYSASMVLPDGVLRKKFIVL